MHMANETMVFDDEFKGLTSYIIKTVTHTIGHNGKPHQYYMYFYVFCDASESEWKTNTNGERERFGWILKGDVLCVDEEGHVIGNDNYIHLYPDGFLGAKEITCEQFEYVRALYDAKKNDERDLIEKVKDLINSSTDYMVKQDYLRL